MNSLCKCLVTLCLTCIALPISAQTRLEKVQTDRAEITENGYWRYNDYFAGVEAAVASGKPMLITLRCIPCEECVKLDEDMIESDPELQRLMDRFERVRLVSTNGLNLSLFQYDYDQSFAVMVMNPDGTVYARYGTRSDHTEWEDDVSVRGLAETLKGALALHEGYPANRELLSGKQGHEPLFETPNDAPTMAGKFPRNLEFNDNVVKNCIHCHMIGDAERELYRERGESIPDEILFQYPHPKSIGLIMDPETQATVRDVNEESAAERAGFRNGDDIKSMNGQPVLSMADIQWVLHHASDPASIETVVIRNGNEISIDLELPDGWRRWDDIAWRVSTWNLRRMATGGLVLKQASNEERRDIGVEEGEMSLLVTHVGQYGEHVLAKRAGFRNGDIIISFNGRSDLARETDLIAYAVQSIDIGARVPVKVMRNGRELEMTLRIQK